MKNTPLTLLITTHLKYRRKCEISPYPLDLHNLRVIRCQVSDFKPHPHPFNAALETVGQPQNGPSHESARRPAAGELRGGFPLIAAVWRRVPDWRFKFTPTSRKFAEPRSGQRDHRTESAGPQCLPLPLAAARRSTAGRLKRGPGPPPGPRPGLPIALRWT